MAFLSFGDFQFVTDDLPEGITLGGEQMLAVMQFPGGFKEVQYFGVNDRNPAWSGTFNYVDAILKVRQLDKIYRSGAVYPLRIGPLMTRYGTLKKFDWVYRNDFAIDYDIEIQLALQRSVLAPDAAGPSAPVSDSPPPQRTYVSVGDDSLWKIAFKFYGDGSQFRKIASANNIQNPDVLAAGTELVIP